jgi:hypothetical protein
MDRGVCACFLVLTLAGLSSCSSESNSNEPKKSAVVLDKIRGKALVLKESTATDSALNAGGPSVYLKDGVQRYRLFVKTPIQVVDGDEYVAEGVNAQKTIEELGDPNQGKNGYPLPSSLARVVNMAWSGQSFDAADGHASVLRGWVKRYPARPLFLVTRLMPAESQKSGEAKAEVKKKELPEVTVAAEQQRAQLIEGPTVQPAPLWEPAGGTVRCKVVINEEGKISELDTGKQLCEAVPWAQFRYQPPTRGGKPVIVKTEAEIRFEPRK